jgi:hypothetical protein
MHCWHTEWTAPSYGIAPQATIPTGLGPEFLWTGKVRFDTLRRPTQLVSGDHSPRTCRSDVADVQGIR